MIQFMCDTCARRKSAKDRWILGFAAEALGITAARREISILPVWDEERALHPLAVHFCSERCKNEYRTKLFGEDAGATESMPRGVLGGVRTKPSLGRKSKSSGLRRSRRKGRAA